MEDVMSYQDPDPKAHPQSAPNSSPIPEPTSCDDPSGGASEPPGHGPSGSGLILDVSLLSHNDNDGAHHAGAVASASLLNGWQTNAALSASIAAPAIDLGSIFGQGGYDPHATCTTGPTVEHLLKTLDHLTCDPLLSGLLDCSPLDVLH
jgi:hypothetical protein